MVVWNETPRSARLAGALLPVFTLAYLWLPRSCPPLQPPALTLDRSAVEAQLRLDRSAAAQLPKTAEVEALDALFLSSGQAELGPFQDGHSLRARLRDSQQRLKKLTAKLGPEVTLQLRAAATERLSNILAGTVTGDLKDNALGSFPNVLDRHHVTHQGHLVAPSFVVRTLYKARWNTLHGLTHADGFTPIEGQAYFGWMALHADRLPLAQRLRALPEFESAGGAHIDEAAGVLLYLAGHYTAAEDALQRAYDKSPSLRLRNYRDGATLPHAQPPP